MSQEPILLVGPGGHALSCVDVIEQEGRYAIAGFIGQAQDLGSLLFGYPVLGTDDNLPRLAASVPNVLITVGQIGTPIPRMRLYERVEGLGCRLPVIVSPRAYVSRHAELGPGTIVMHGAVVNAGARVGRNCIINSLALVEHGAEIADHCHVSTGAVINGDVRIGSGTFVGSQSSVRQAVVIGARCVIGMGQVVLRDCMDGTILPLPKVTK